MPGVWPGVMRSVIVSSPSVTFWLSLTTSTSRFGSGRFACGPRAFGFGRSIMSQSSLLIDDLRPVLLLEVRRAAEMVEVAVADDDVLHVCRLETDLHERRLDDLLRFVNGVERVDQDDALIGRDRPCADRVEAEVVEVVEQLDDVDLSLRLGSKTGVLAQHRRPLRTEHRARFVETRQRALALLPAAAFAFATSACASFEFFHWSSVG